MHLALFDFDGTITTHETMPAFVRRSVSTRRLWLGQCQLAPIIIGYKCGLVSGVRVRHAIVRVGYRGVPVPMLQRFGVEFARDYLPTVLRPEAMARIDWHRAQEHRIVVVSGGLDVYLAPWCAAHGLELLCSSLAQRDAVLTGDYAGVQCVGAEKARRVRERFQLRAFSTIHAYGDTREDLELLALATHRMYRWQEQPAPTTA